MTTELLRCLSAAQHTLRTLALLMVYGVPGVIFLIATFSYFALLAMGEVLVYDRTIGMTEDAVTQMATTGPWHAPRAAETQPSTYGEDFLVHAVPPERLQARNCEMYVEWRLYRVRFLQLRDAAGEHPTMVGRRIVIERNLAAFAYVPALFIGIGFLWLYLANQFRRLTAPRYESRRVQSHGS